MDFFKVICSWCGEFQKYKDAEGKTIQKRGFGQELISHGCCPSCYEKQMAEVSSMT